MRFSQMPENSHRQRLATTGVAKALYRLFFSISHAEDRGGRKRCRADELIHRSGQRRLTTTTERRQRVKHPVNADHKSLLGSRLCSAISVTIMLRFKRAVDGDAEIVGLFFCQLG